MDRSSRTNLGVARWFVGRATSAYEVHHHPPSKKAKSAGVGSAAVVVFATATKITTSDTNADRAPNDANTRRVRLSGDPVLANLFHNTTLMPMRTTATMAASTAIAT